MVPGAAVAGTGGSLLERDAELAALRAAVLAARRRAGAVVIIQGSPGVGKSALLRAAEAYGQSAGVQVMAGRGRELERNVALGVAAELLAPPVLAADEPERARLLAGLAAPAASLLLDPREELLATPDTALRGLCWVAAHLAGWNRRSGKSRPLLITVDDVQWADLPSLRFLAMLADRADRLPLSLLLTVRDGEPSVDLAVLRCLTTHPRARLLAPAPLTAAAVVRLASAQFPQSGPDIAAAVAHASGGNPFFVRELLRSLHADAAAGFRGGGTPSRHPGHRPQTPSGSSVLSSSPARPGTARPSGAPSQSGAAAPPGIADPSGAPVVSGATVPPGIAGVPDAPAPSVTPDAPTIPAAEVARLVPDAVLRSVLTRLGRLSDDAVRLAASLAVLGDGTPLSRAAAHAGMALPQAEQAADVLAGAQLLRPGNPLEFAHPLVGTAVHADLPAFTRARAHRRAADLLAAAGENPDKVASHLLVTEPEGDAGTVTTLTAAARRAARRGDPGAAARLLGRALAEPPPAAWRPALLIELAQVQATSGEVTAHDSLSEALCLLREADVHARAGALSVLARIDHARGDLASAAAASGQALDLLDPRDPAWQEALADFLTVATFHPPLAADAGQRLAPVLREARRGQLPQAVRLLAHITLRMALAGDPPALVRQAAAQALASNPLVDPDDHGTLFGLIAHALVIAGEWFAAEAAADAALAAAGRRGDLLAYSSAAFHRALSRFRRGALTAALADLEASHIDPHTGWQGAAGWAAALAAEIHLDRGDHAAARLALRLAVPQAPDSMDASLLDHARARLALAEHDAATALTAAQSAGRRLEKTFQIDHPGFLPWRTTAALAAHHLGDRGQASYLAAAALDRARATGVTPAVGAALRLSGLVGRSGPDTAVLAEAVTVLHGTAATLEHARALIALGSALRRGGRREACRAPLREGLAVADRLDARPLAEHARAELRAAGVRPRRSAVTGIDALTPAERRVALLALRGDGNATIAQTLFVTTKTVETHLSRAYRKLGITSRRQLQDVYGPTATAPRTAAH